MWNASLAAALIRSGDGKDTVSSGPSEEPSSATVTRARA